MNKTNASECVETEFAVSLGFELTIRIKARISLHWLLYNDANHQAETNPNTISVKNETKFTSILCIQQRYRKYTCTTENEINLDLDSSICVTILRTVVAAASQDYSSEVQHFVDCF